MSDNTIENDIGIVGVARNAAAVFETIQATLTALVFEQAANDESVDALSERVDVMQRELAAHVADLRRHERQPAPPGADAGDAFVDAERRLGEAVVDVLSWGQTLNTKPPHEIYIPGLARAVSGLGEAWAVHAAARAAALPERSAPAPVTITRQRLMELARIFDLGAGSMGSHTMDGLYDLLRALGYEVSEP